VSVETSGKPTAWFETFDESCRLDGVNGDDGGMRESWTSLAILEDVLDWKGCRFVHCPYTIGTCATLL
jgi:hypothetical protein